MKRKTVIIAVWFLVILSIPLVTRANVYTEKRNLFIGGYVEYLNSKLNQVDFAFEDRLKSYGFNMNFGWFLHDDLALGLKVGYSYSQDKEISTSEGYNFDIKTDLFRVGMFMRYYLELTRSISFFVEGSAVAGFGGIDARYVTDIEPPYTSSGNRFDLEVGFRPGLVIFINKGFAAELTVGFLGFSYSRQDTGNNPYDLEASETQLDFSMDVNLLRIQFGLAIYF